jgi:hypothetical protein
MGRDQRGKRVIQRPIKNASSPIEHPRILVPTVSNSGNPAVLACSAGSDGATGQNRPHLTNLGRRPRGFTSGDCRTARAWARES